MWNQCPMTDAELDELLATPTPAVIELMSRIDGDIAVLGVGGKMGRSLAECAVRASREAGTKRTVYGVSRFSTPGLQEKLEK